MQRASMESVDCEEHCYGYCGYVKTGGTIPRLDMTATGVKPPPLARTSAPGNVQMGSSAPTTGSYFSQILSRTSFGGSSTPSTPTGSAVGRRISDATMESTLLALP